MTQAIRNYLLADGNIGSILLVAVVFLIGAIGAIFYAAFLTKKIFGAWNDISDSFVCELNSIGLDIVNVLIEIAMIGADKHAAFAIGKVKQEIANSSANPNFFINLLEFSEKIHDNNHTQVLNSDYAKAREAIKEAIALAGAYQKVKGLEEFAQLAVKTSEAKKEIADAAENLRGILYGLKQA
ncbi:MAG: hypothetical protein WC682_04155 [Parcubacteria group bacterium]|jgi:hypothetical protein